MRDIPEQAIQAAYGAYVTFIEEGGSVPVIDAVRAALTAARPFISGQAAVKKLEWELVSGDHYAEGSGTHYNIYETKPGLWNSVTVKPGNVRLATNVSLEDAKAAAQADYEARILSALEPSAARSLALEEILREVDEIERKVWTWSGSAFLNNELEGAEDADCKTELYSELCGIGNTMHWLRTKICALSSQDHADAGKVEGDGWLPIESAPKDGTIVLLGWNDPDIEEIGAVAGWYEGGPADKCWYDQYHEPVTATHWMPLRPLPAAPASEGAE